MKIAWQTPDRILDAPEIVDDYYLNLLDWSSKNVVAVALGAAVYLWHAETGAIEQLLKTTIVDDYISSISWAEDGRTIAVGFNNHEVQLWDTCRACKVCAFYHVSWRYVFGRLMRNRLMLDFLVKWHD